MTDEQKGYLQALSDLRRRFRPNGFAILLIDTNGRVLLTRPMRALVRFALLG